ncbi:MAG TPA: PASTA domain-containing protein [Chitinivibrionales bacterium]|jgi:serine/threonine-protein kinase|nr:PASTA domain-containing protein [Chitinivibrionales bacterium]
MKKNYSISIPADLLWKVILPSAVVACLAGGAAGIFIVDKLIMPGIVHTDRQVVAVPSLVKLPWEKARQRLFDVGLRLQVRGRQYDEKIARDGVISQQPGADEKVKKGRMVAVVLSKGSETGVVPDVRKLIERKAVIELRKQGFIVGKRKHDFSDSLEKDMVVQMSPAQGSSISKEMPVDLVISDGVKPTHADMPNLIGESLLDAKKKIEDSGLKLGKLDYKANATLSPGTVISQSVPPGSSVPLQSAVNIVVSVVN